MHIIALSLTTMLTFGFAPSPPLGTPYVVETIVGSYPCTILAAKCIVNVPSPDLALTSAVCIYPKSDPASRQCTYWMNLIVAPPKVSKRRVVGKH